MALQYPCYWIRKDNGNQWYWTYHATNGLTIARSSESYVAKGDCERSIEIMKASYNTDIYITE
jgi:uncharacterized protein YegP (UPF0339 family)